MPVAAYKHETILADLEPVLPCCGSESHIPVPGIQPICLGHRSALGFVRCDPRRQKSRAVDGGFDFRLRRLGLLSLRLSIDHLPFFVESVPRKLGFLFLLLLLPLVVFLLLLRCLAGGGFLLLLLGSSRSRASS